MQVGINRFAPIGVDDLYPPAVGIAQVDVGAPGRGNGVGCFLDPDAGINQLFVGGVGHCRF